MVPTGSTESMKMKAQPSARAAWALQRSRASSLSAV